MNIGWITLRVSNLDDSLVFYRDLLGLTVEKEFGGDEQKIIFLGGKEDTKVELLWKLGEKIENVGKGVSIGFEVSGLDEWMRRIRESGARSITGPFSPNPSIRFCFFSDPDGYQIQLYENLGEK
ncbi:MAG: VOC family protein [Synergistaceae bacterium]|jgi:lactoylglutathione lyase|nr:VOC family protein [Synergistaceae bacterium]